MDSIGDYLYIVILAIIGLSSLFKKKSKEEVNIPKTDESTVMPWDEIETIEPYDSTYKEEDHQQQAFNPKVSYETTNDYSQLKSKKTVTTILPSKETKKQIEQNETEPVSIQLNSEEDAKMAFLYSEIFTRKYASK
jgi:hypothetical protein